MALAIDPRTPRTLYAATSGSGVFKSTDAGATWAAVNTPDYARFATSLVIDPITPSTLYVGGGGVFRSTDAGRTWSATALTTTISVLAIDPITSSTLYAGRADCDISNCAGGGVFKSTDAGATWAAADAGLNQDDYPGPWGITALVIDPLTPSTVYAGTFDGGVFKSTDAGATWGAANAGLTNLFVGALAIDPATPSTVHAGTGGVFSIQQIAGCIGDCRGDGTVTVDDLITGVNIALGTAPPEACPSLDRSDDRRVSVNEIIAAVNSALAGCPTEGPTERLSGTLYVTDSLANKLHAIDAASGDILAPAVAGDHPVGVETANGKVYVANEAAGTISVYDSATLSPVTVIPACERPHHTAVSPGGHRSGYAARILRSVSSPGQERTQA